MKNFVIAVVLGSISMPALATEAGDTIVIENAKKVKIETRENVQRIVINGSNDDDAFQYTQRINISDTSDVKRTIRSVRDFNKLAIKHDGKPTKWGHSLHLNLGLNTMTGVGNDMNGVKNSFPLWPSLELGVAWTADWHPFGKKNEWSIGLGLNMRMYESKDTYYWAKNAQNQLYNELYNPALTERNTDIAVLSWQLPIIYTHRFDDAGKWKVSLGAIINLNSSVTAERHFEAANLYGHIEEHDVKTDHIGARKVSVDAFVALKLRYLPTLYCKYCPQQFFRDNRGPKMHQLSFGICF